MKSLSSFLLMSMLCLQLFSCKSSPNNENQSVSSIPTNQIDFAMNGFYYASSIPSIVLEIQEKGKAFEMNEIAFGSVRALGEIQFINEEKTQFRVAEEQGESAPLYTLDKSTKTIKLRKYNANTDEYDNIAYVQKSQKVDYNSYQNKVALFVAKLYGKDIKDLDNNESRFRYAMHDLNGDGMQEYIVTILNGDYCGSGGCTFWVLTNGMEIISKTTVADFPFLILQSKTNGWNDIAVTSDNKLKRLKFANPYPSNASTQPNYVGGFSSKEVVGQIFKGI